MTPAKQRDTGLTIHRVLQWVSSIGITVVGAVAISGMGTWDKLKDQGVRMEGVPAAVESIRGAVGDLATTVALEVQVNQQQSEEIHDLKSKRR